MKKVIITGALVILIAVCHAQDFGLSFSYFLPRNGYFSTPISPFSIRGVGFDLNRFVAIETGASLYRMSGLNLKDIPLETKDPLVGPNFTILVPAELVFGLKGNSLTFDIKGGGFFFYAFGNRIDYGNLDRALKTEYDLAAVNADVSFKAKPGFGYHGGAELTVYVTDQVGVSLESNYFVGEAAFPLSGSYTGGQTSFETVALDFPEAKIDFTGFEFSVGLIFSAGSGRAPKKPAGRRRR